MSLALNVKSLAFGNLFPVLVLGFEPKSVNSLATLLSRRPNKLVIRRLLTYVLFYSRCLNHTYFFLVDRVFVNDMASKIPKVVTFGYDEFEMINDKKWCAKCKHCGKKITET